MAPAWKASKYRRVLLLRWVESLDVGPVVDEGNLCAQFKNGLYLIRILQRLDSLHSFVGIRQRPRSASACIANLELALACVWQRSVRASQMPSSQDLLRASSADVWVGLLNTVFEVYVLRELRKKFRETIRWYQAILARYSRALDVPPPPRAAARSDAAADGKRAKKPPSALARYEREGLCRDFQSCVNIFCVLHAHEQSLFPRARGAPQLSFASVFEHPADAAEVHSNALYVFQKLVDAGIPLFWTAEEWIDAPDAGFVLFQVSLLSAELSALTPDPPFPASSIRFRASGAGAAYASPLVAPGSPVPPGGGLSPEALQRIISAVSQNPQMANDPQLWEELRRQIAPEPLAAPARAQRPELLEPPEGSDSDEFVAPRVSEPVRVPPRPQRAHRPPRRDAPPRRPAPLRSVLKVPHEAAPAGPTGPARELTETQEALLDLSHPEGLGLTLRGPDPQPVSLRLVGIEGTVAGPQLKPGAALEWALRNGRARGAAALLGRLQLLEIKNLTVAGSAIIVAGEGDGFGPAGRGEVVFEERSAEDARRFAESLSRVLAEAYAAAMARHDI
eukprot:gnl/Chilomastix_cuspidata/1196.p1 GENE.gnl/Chilomastix_cuspidata/1196~~gnl/Chilomastix_cuspidata/1196.p1  ORF type:complete len:564 (-),score=273.02 gnl/Chilomastix_cuspidata/1196:132-1823(-)